LRDLANPEAPTGADIYALAFHVDYWNDLGWADPFSTAWATQRQLAYARALGQQGVYTPQMIVNGRDAFIGSDRGHARRSVDGAIGLPSLRISLRVEPAKSEISLDFELSTPPASDAVLQLALVEANAVTQVKAGENAGRTLRHSNIVRAFQSVPLDGGQRGHAVLLRPAAPPMIRAEVIAYVQNPRTMSIQAASRATL
jgi:hypothetical protein